MTRRESQELRHLELVVSRIEEQKIDLTADYKDWMSICFACATLEEEKGRELLHRICRFYPKYSQTECDQKFDYCKRGGRGEIHLASIFELAKKHGVDISMPKGRRKKEGEDEEAMTRSELVVEFLKGKPIRYDVVSRKNQILRDGQWVELKERDRNTLLYECCKWAKKDISSTIFQDMLHSDAIPMAHPLREYVTSQPAWAPSQPDYLAQVAAMVHVQPSSGRNIQALWEECFKKWFVAMVASWMVDEIVNHQVLVLIGEQGIFKTSWLDFLIPEALKEYRCKQSGSDRLDKDEQLRATEFALINLDEIDKLTERELNANKSLITATDVNVRVAYGTSKERYVRLASYVASGNKDKFLTDNTGNRRWLPFRVERIDSPYQSHFPYAGMYAQALYLFQHDFSYWFDQDKIKDMSDHVNEFMVESMEEQLIQVYFAPAKPGDANAKFLTLAEISSRLISNGNIRKPLDMRSLGTHMKKQGFVSSRDNSRCHRGYIVLEKTTAEIEMTRKQLAMEMEIASSPKQDSEQILSQDSDQTLLQFPEQGDLPF